MTESEAKTLVEQHRKAGDLIDFLLKMRDESFKDFDMLNKHWTKEEEKGYCDKLHPHIDSLVEEHKKNGDFDSWFQDLKINDIPRCNYIRGKFLQKELKEKYAKKISEHREKGDLIDFIWEEIEKENLAWIVFCDINNSEYMIDRLDDLQVPIEKNIYFLLDDKERKEMTYIYAFANDRTLFSEHLNYIYKLSQKKHDTFEYKRYKKIYERISSNNRKQGKEIENYIKNKKLKRIILISLSVWVILLVAGITVKCAVGNNSKDAQRNDEKQRVEKYESKSGLKKIE